MFDIGTFGDQLFIAMELIRGHTLRKIIVADALWADKLASPKPMPKR